MKFYHASMNRYGRLVPQVGSKRHSGEDPRARGVPVVWLTSEPHGVFSDGDGVPFTYQHEVDIDPGDPDLSIDKDYDTFMNEADAQAGRTSTDRWYFYAKAIDVTTVRTYDAATKKYV